MVFQQTAATRGTRDSYLCCWFFVVQAWAAVTDDAVQIDFGRIYVLVLHNRVIWGGRGAKLSKDIVPYQCL